MLRRQKPDKWYAYPEHRKGLDAIWRKIIYNLGFDPLTVYERLKQIDIERQYWKDTLDKHDEWCQNG